MFVKVDAHKDEENLVVTDLTAGISTKSQNVKSNVSITKIHKLYKKISKNVGFYYVLNNNAKKTILYNLVPHTPIICARLIGSMAYLEDFNIIFLDNSGLYFYTDSVSYEELIVEQAKETAEIFKENGLQNTVRMLCVGCAGVGYWLDIINNNPDLFDCHTFYASMLNVKPDNSYILMLEFLKAIFAYEKDEMDVSYLFWSWGRNKVPYTHFPKKFWKMKNVKLLHQFLKQVTNGYYIDKLKNVKNKYYIYSDDDNFLTPANNLVELFDDDKIFNLFGGHFHFKSAPSCRDQYIGNIRKIFKTRHNI